MMHLRFYPLVLDAQHGLRLMGRDYVRLRIDRTRSTAALVGDVHDIGRTEDGDYALCQSAWTPVPFAIAEEMATKLHKFTKETVGDHPAWRIGWEASGYDWEVADWYCHKI